MKIKVIAIRLLAVLSVLVIAARAQETAAQKYLVSVERIWDRAPHNAFTDLAEFNGRLYCAFREGQRGDKTLFALIESDQSLAVKLAATPDKPVVDSDCRTAS
ncbi:MAG: hypothetical protein ACREEM_39160 [Blastocatellia bacterium]